MVALTAVSMSQSRAGAAASVSLSRSPVVATVSPRYLSFAVDMDQVVGGSFWSQAPGATGKAPVAPYDFGRERLMNLTRALSPAYLRISGTAADETYFDLQGLAASHAPSGYSRVLTSTEWDAANQFARRLGLEIFLGINAGPGPRNADGSWNPDNAAQLLEYTARLRYPLGALEFGNEPNLISEVPGMSAGYSAADYARDLARFRELQMTLAPQAVVVGPGSFYDSGGAEYFGVPLGPLASQILALGANDYGALSWHAYAARSTRCATGAGEPVPPEPLDPSFLDGILNSYENLRRLRDAYAPGRPLWYGEGATAYCGGQQGYSDRWEATFWYLNALGALARRDVKVFVRQTLSGSDYGLITDSTMQPNPDYWAAVMWRRLMGVRMLRPSTLGLPGRVRVFASCSPRGGGTTLLALNLDPHSAHGFTLRGGPRRREIYLATSTSLTGTRVLLNGRVLESNTQGQVGRLRSRVTSSRFIALPAASYAFIVSRGSSPPACRGR